MRILWISSIAWKSSGEYPYPVNGAGAVSGSLFQQSMIEGLEKHGHTVDIISDYPYAIGKNIKRKISWSHNGTASDIAVKTITTPYLSLLHKARSLKNAVKYNLRTNDYDFAIAYLIHQPYMSAVAYAKRLNSKLKTVLICPDLPDMMDMSLSQKKFKAFLKMFDKKRIDKLYGKMDGFVLFAKPMLERINIGNAKYTVIEGIASVDDLDITPVKKESFVMYAGTLHKNIGIENIIASLDHIDNKSVNLKLYGTGELEGYIKQKAKQDKRIIYGGFIDRKTLFEEEKKAIALVNTRNPNDAYTKYSFPSKTFEYLYSGTPFVTTKLEGVPEEYSEHLFETESDSPQNVAKVINTILESDKKTISEHGDKARSFVLNCKNKTKQSYLLSEFLKHL